jgi:predicted glycosyltransferase
MGIGHMRRNTVIAEAIASSGIPTSILLITGAREACAFSLPPGADCLSLPSYEKEPNGSYQTRSLSVSLGDLVTLRSRMILAGLKAFNPDALIVDKVPRGALKELEPALQFLRRRGNTRCVLGLRDILDDSATVKREWTVERTEKAIRDYYSAIWIYGDPAIYDQVAEYAYSSCIAAKVCYTGYLSRQRRSSTRTLQSLDVFPPGVEDPDRLLVCMVGGGQDGAELAATFARLDFPENTMGIIVTGPYMPSASRDYLLRAASARPRLRVLRFVPDPAPLLNRADCVVAMGGYNTVCELLSFQKRALIVPRISPRVEQWIRADRFHRLGLLDVLHPDQVNPMALARWLFRKRESGLQRTGAVRMDGAAKVPELLEELIHGSLRPDVRRGASRSLRHVVH